MKKSILKKLQFYIYGFGILMGFIFPVYANFFVIWKKGMFVFFLTGCICAGIIVGLVSFLLVKLILLKPLMKVSDVANDLKEKNITTKIDLYSNDNVGDIVNGINEAINNLKSFINEIGKTSELIEKILDKQGDNTDITGNISTIEKSIDTVNKATHNISLLSKDIEKVVFEGKESVRHLQKNISNTEDASGSLSEILHSMNLHFKNIKSVMELIEAIASKTDLLSINANIESARAGEHGKSFAIVAGEVRKLAFNVTNSTEKIDQTILLLQKDIQTAIDNIRIIHSQATDNSSESIELGVKFNNIEDITLQNQDANQNLVSAVRNLNESFTFIQKSFDDLAFHAHKLKIIVDEYQH